MLLPLLRNRRGATFVEYVLLVGVVALGAIAGLRRARVVENRTITTQARMVAQIESGSASELAALGLGSFLTPPAQGGGRAPPRPAGPLVGGGCFAAGTLVATSEGLRPIETVHEGDLLWSRDETTGDIALKPVLTRYVTPRQPVMEIRVAADNGGEIIRPTPAHPFWVTGQGWIEAQNLYPSESLWAPSGEPLHLAVSSPSDLAYETVYNFEIADYHTYFVGEHSILVHNAQPPTGGGGLPPNPCSAGLPGAGFDPVRLNELAKDPGQGGKITPKTLQEARVALDLERSGRLTGPVTRSPDPMADFIDGNGQKWDVKTFNSNFPPSKGGYTLDASMQQIGRELNRKENVILDTSNLSPAAITELTNAVNAAGWADKVIFWP
jgi:Flp pilus assembly pilin Flp